MDVETTMMRTPADGPQAITPNRDPVVWLILSEKTGDNAQLLALAEALPWPSLTKRVEVQEPYRLGKPRVTASLHHIDPGRSDALQPPWPDLVIAVGRRMSMVALWIQSQAGGHPRLVLLGAPRRFANRFDLAVVSEQYRQGHRSNEMRITYPLQRIDEAGITAEAEARRDEFAKFAHPKIAVLVGGATKAVRFDAAVAARLARDVAELARNEQGSLLVTTSRRTPPEVVEVLARDLPAGAMLHRWSEGSARNPYRALLGLADRFVVTSDSLSMMMEIARLGRPLAIYPLPESSGLAWIPLVARSTVARRLAAIGQHRDLTAIPKALVRDGFAVWFGERFRSAGRRPPDQLAEVAERIVGLMQRQPREERPAPLTARICTAIGAAAHRS
jgi:mitochondrial fission protein ELM1